MDPISIIVTALATGAAAGLKPTAEKAVSDAYAAIKALIKRKYERVSVDVLENDPGDEARQKIVRQDLERFDAASDEELLREAKTVLDAVQEHAPEAAQAVGVKLEDIKGASLKIADIIATGTGVDVKGAEIEGDIDIRGVRAGQGGRDRPKR